MKRIRITDRWVRMGRLAFLGLILGWSMAPLESHAGGTIQIDNVRSVSVGMGLRSSFLMVEDASPDGDHWSNDFGIDSFRFYLSGSILQNVKFEFNTDYDRGAVQTSAAPTFENTEDIRILDAVLKFEFNDYVNVWAGRFLPPSDRSNLSGPYFLNAYDFPFVQKYPAVFAGRDDGAAFWGQIGGGMFKYQLGAFEGQGDDSASGPNQNDSLLYAGRLVLNLWDPEPGYYNSSTYYGGMNVLALGLSGMTQNNAAGSAGAAGDFMGWNVDLLVERNLAGAGVATLEGAYYDYDRDGVDPPATGDALEGDGYFVLGSYLLPAKLGVGMFQGQLQPVVRYQQFDNGGQTTGSHNRWDLALGYILNGHNARITATYSLDDPTSGPDADIFRIGLQFQI